MVTVIGSVPSPSHNTSDPSEPRRFTVETSVYDVSKASPVPFSVACFFENTKRWQKVRTPSPGALLSITAKVAGRITDTNQLALRVLDLSYMSRPAQAPRPRRLRPLLRLQSGPLAGRVGPLHRPLQRDNASLRAPATLRSHPTGIQLRKKRQEAASIRRT